MTDEPREVTPTVGREAPEGEDAPPLTTLRRILHRLHAWREGIRARRTPHLIYRSVVGLVGCTLVIGGLALVPLPGPGWLIVILGLFVLASEFERADRLLQFTRKKVAAWTEWVGGQPWSVRIALGLATFVFVGCVVWAMAVAFGVPAWVPDWLVPPLPGLDPK